MFNVYCVSLAYFVFLMLIRLAGGTVVQKRPEFKPRMPFCVVFGEVSSGDLCEYKCECLPVAVWGEPCPAPKVSLDLLQSIGGTENHRLTE